MDTIRQIVEKIKLFGSSYAEELGVSVVIILVAFSSFYLGRTSTNQPNAKHERIAVESVAPASTSQALTVDTRLPTAEVAGNVGQVIASKTGKRYYYPWCSGVSRISPANIVHFASAAEAEKFGLALATNCSTTK